MAELREVVIRIKNDEVESESTSPNDKTKKTSDTKPLTIVLLNQVYESVKNQVVNQVNYEIDKHFQLTDNYIAKRSFNEAMSVINFAVGVGTSAVSGFVLGSSAGIGGGIAGAIVGASVQVMSTITNVVQNYDREQIEMRQLEGQLSFSRERAGYSLTSGSVGENK